MERLAGEAFDAGQMGKHGTTQLSGRRDHHPGAQHRTVGQSDDPDGAAAIENRLAHFGTETQMRQQPELACAMPEIAVDLRLPGEGMRPVGVGLEGEGIEVGRTSQAAPG